MTPLQLCLNYLDSLGVGYSHTSDSNVGTTQQVADLPLTAAQKVVQTFVLKADSQFLLVVVPADSFIEIDKVHSMAGTSTLRFATEAEISALFSFGEVERVPPLGGLAGAAVYLDLELADEESIVFHACTRHDLIHMKTADFQHLAHTVTGSFSATDYQKEFRRRLLASAQKAGM
jgi:prolyl-tRNA editing enzyme YbaK/EbsC (Cys-tRNA(Pro) deacylase)